MSMCDQQSGDYFNYLLCNKQARYAMFSQQDMQWIQETLITLISDYTNWLFFVLPNWLSPLLYEYLKVSKTFFF